LNEKFKIKEEKMDKLKYIKLEQQDGSYSTPIPLSVDAEHIDMEDGETLVNKLNKKPYYYNTVADMKADIKLKAGDMAITLGYYSKNDDGGAEYIIRTKTQSDIDDGGSIHVIMSSLVAELIIKNEINIKQFGAKGDDFTDDTISIQNAINLSSKNKIKLVIPFGIFRVESLNLKSNTKIIGLSKTNSVIRRISTFNTDNYGNNYRTGYIIGYYPQDDSRIENIHIFNFCIDGIKNELEYSNQDYQRNAITNNIYIRLCDNLIIDNMIIKNSSKSGINVKASNFVNIKNSNFNNNGNNIEGIDANGITITGNYYSDKDLMKYEYLCNHILISNNQCYENTDEGIAYCNCNDIIIENNRITNNADRGIEGDSTTFTKNAEKLNIQIVNNFIDSNATNGITEYSSAQNINYICKGNIIRNVNDIAIGIGIESDDHANIIIENNIIENCENQPFNIVTSNIICNNNILKNAKGSITISGQFNVEFNSNIIDNSDIYSNSIYIKSDELIKISNNNINNYLRNITIQRFNSDTSEIKNVIVNDNIIKNLINLVVVSNNIQNMTIDNNICDDTRDTPLFQTILSISNNTTVTNCNITNNNDKKALYGLDITKITNLRRINNSKDIYTNLSTRYMPSASATYQKKGDIAFNTNIASGNPVGWIFDGTE
jgi:parallel beta-helix repeat protein